MGAGGAGVWIFCCRPRAPTAEEGVRSARDKRANWACGATADRRKGGRAARWAPGYGSALFPALPGRGQIGGELGAQSHCRPF